MAGRETDEWWLIGGTDLLRMGLEKTSGAPQWARQKGWAPRIDLFDLPDHLVLRVELAAVRSENVSLHYDPDRRTLVVRGERGEDALIEAAACPLQLEIEYGEFAREVSLPDVPLDVQAARTQFAGGLLTVVLPKGPVGEQAIVVKRTVRIRKA